MGPSPCFNIDPPQVILQPGNWSTVLYPDNARGGGDYNVVISSGPEPVLLDTVEINQFTVSAPLELEFRGQLTIANGLVDNTSTISLNDTSGSSGQPPGADTNRLRFGPNAQLTGTTSGQIQFVSPNFNVIESTAPGITPPFSSTTRIRVVVRPSLRLQIYISENLLP